MRLRLLAAWVVLGLGMSSLTSCGLKIGKVPDEAKRADREPESLKAADEDYFQDMDYGLTKEPRHGRGCAVPLRPRHLASGRGQGRRGGPQRVDDLDGRQRPLLGPSFKGECGCPRPPKNGVEPPRFAPQP